MTRQQRRAQTYRKAWAHHRRKNGKALVEGGVHVTRRMRRRLAHIEAFGKVA
jgi:hypothetical protein